MGARICIVVAIAAGCHVRPDPAVPGQTEIAVSKVEIEARAGEHLEGEYEPLIENLGLRGKNLIFPERTFNEYRLAEDRRRVLAYLQGHGRFDAEVDEPELAWSADKKSVAVTWKIHEGAAYKISQLEIVGAPAENVDELRAALPFHVGDAVDVDTYRPLRRTLAELLQDRGYGHARGYSRAFVDREHKTVAWFYYMDPGPQTKVGTIAVEGNRNVTVSAILERAGLAPGAPYSTAAKRRAELALLDTGAFASAVVMSDADIQTGPPEFPDTGGVLAPEQVDANGDIVPRKLGDALALRVIVVEAPAKQVRAEVGLEGDPSRIDAYAGTRITLRNLLGVQHHVVLDGNVGYGWMIRGNHSLSEGVYGSAQAQYVHPGFLTPDLDVRVTGRWRDVLYPDTMLREFAVGPGVRSTLAPNTFVDVDAYYRLGITRGLDGLDAMTRTAAGLPTSDRSTGPELVASFIADRRDDRVEPTSGWFVGTRGSFSPGGPLADDRWVELAADVRGFVPLGGAWSLGGRVSGGEIVGAGASGVPLGPRLFGGGPFGMRGFGRDRLSPTACMMTATSCDAIDIGGKSLVESSAELRYLPFRKFYGVTAFVDAGAAGATNNPAADGVSAAVGLGLRLRSWYLPVAFDFSYRAVDHAGGTDTHPSTWDRLLILFRIGEAF